MIPALMNEGNQTEDSNRQRSWYFNYLSPSRVEQQNQNGDISHLRSPNAAQSVSIYMFINREEYFWSICLDQRIKTFDSSGATHSDRAWWQPKIRFSRLRGFLVPSGKAESANEDVQSLAHEIDTVAGWYLQVLLAKHKRRPRWGKVGTGHVPLRLMR